MILSKKYKNLKIMEKKVHVNISANLFIIIATDVHIKLTLKATTITSTKMSFTEEDKHLIKFLMESKGYGSRRFL